jgi:hypothetical protein
MTYRRSMLAICLASAGLLCGTNGLFAAAVPAQPVQNRPAAEDPNKPETIIVARIGDYAITKAQLRDRLIQEVPPNRDYDADPNRTVTTLSVLNSMLAEKAMMIEGRKQGLLADKDVHTLVERYRQGTLIQLMLADHVSENLKVTDAEVETARKADPNLTAEQAKNNIQRTKVGPLLDQFYAQLLTKFKVVKVKENFAKASKAHQRLLTQPAKPRDPGVAWITGQQIETELTAEEKTLVLATFEGGRVTLTDWLNVLNDFPPPSRPKDLDTADGVDRFTDRALQGPVLMAEAVARGYEKNKKYVEGLRTVEDNNLMGKVLSDKLSHIAEPNEAQLKAYFDAHAARFGNNPSVKVNQIWCKDEATAQKVKAQLAGGTAFDAVKKDFSLRRDEAVHDTWPAIEGVFWAGLSKAEPNTVIGPIKGFYDPRIKWRIVKVLEKKPGSLLPFAQVQKERIKETMMTEKMLEIRGDFEKQMLAKYPPEIYAEKIKDVDPLAVSTDDTPVR